MIDLKRLTLLCLPCMGACLTGWTNDVPTATVTPVASAELMPAWTALLQRDVDDWNARLEAVGCQDPFVVGPPSASAHNVILVPPSAWTRPEAAAYYADWGYESDWDIMAMDTPGRAAALDGPDIGQWNVLKHELGHATGLGHADEKRFGPSMMGVSGGLFAFRDVIAAACAMGCLAPDDTRCDTSKGTVDPYDIP